MSDAPRGDLAIVEDSSAQVTAGALLTRKQEIKTLWHRQKTGVTSKSICAGSAHEEASFSSKVFLSQERMAESMQYQLPDLSLGKNHAGSA